MSLLDNGEIWQKYGRAFPYYALLLSSHNVLHYALCSMHLHHFYHPHTMNVLLCISTITSQEVLPLNVLLSTSISPHRMATDLPPPTSPHSLYSLAPKSNQRRICQQYPKYLKTKIRQKWRSSPKLASKLKHISSLSTELKLGPGRLLLPWAIWKTREVYDFPSTKDPSTIKIMIYSKIVQMVLSRNHSYEFCILII